MPYWNPKSYCSRCKRYLDVANFYERTDRIGYFAMCKSCMTRTPVTTTTQIGPSEIQIVEKESRTLEYPKDTDRGGGSLFG